MTMRVKGHSIPECSAEVKDGERFGGGTVNPDDVFESFEEDASEADGGF